MSVALTAFCLCIRAEDLATGSLDRAGDNGLVREVRVALVCYGGSSLAIYIHGNAKELHRLVLASKALQIDALANHSKMQSDMADLTHAKKPEAGAAGRALTGSTRVWYERLLDLWWSDPKRVRTRVVVDVIAGTSAGGINGVILAKALAHDLSQDSLTALWMEKASLRRLTDNYFRFFRILAGDAPINGDAMVGWLFDALDGMDRQAKNGLGTHSLLPDGDRLDLFVTTTDLKGYPQQVVVNDPPLAAEKHFPHVLHFIYSGQKRGCNIEPRAGFDDFCPAWTPSLAFAARASSSIPGVFPPLSLGETLTLLGRRSTKPIPDVAAPPPIETVVNSFFRNDQLQEATGGSNYATDTFFVDGGVLDNHPFGPAIAEIRRRPNDQEVSRFLLYLQPDPGKRPEPPDPRDGKPGLIATIWAGLSGIPSNQPILNDLNDIESYNEKVRRIRDIVSAEEAATAALDRENNIAGDCEKTETLNVLQRMACASHLSLNHLDEELMAADAGTLRRVRQNVEAEADKGVTELAGRSYYTLRVHSVLDQFVEVISSERACYYPPESAHRALVAAIIDRWAKGDGQSDGLIGTAKDARAQRERQKEFLTNFDVGYQRRQLRFVTEWIDEQYASDPPQRERKALDQLKSAAARRIADLTLLVRGQAPDAVLVAQMGKVKELFGGLNPWQQVNGKPATLATLADLFVQQHRGDLDALTMNLGTAIRDLQQKVREDSYSDFKTQGLDLPPSKRRQILVRYFGFPMWDRQIYPLVAFSEMGEFAGIKVIRLSPDDATLLGGGTAKEKLVGAKAAHFGAFLSRPGREADYVWGRLDAAERLLTMLEIPVQDRRPKELFQAIIDEVRAKEGNLIRESILKEREADIKAHLPN
jgi:patatin-related protein